MTSTRSFLLLFVEATLLHYILVEQVNGFFLQHPSGSSILSNSCGGRSLETKNRFILKSSASPAVTFPETNSSSFQMNEEANSFEQSESETTRSYPWSDRIPIKQKKMITSTKSQEETVISSFALWKTLQNDVPELAGYPIEFLQDRYEDILRGDQTKNDKADDEGENNGAIKSVEPPPAPGILPYLQDYEFSSAGGVSGYVYGMDGVSDGSRIETSAVGDVKESLPRGFIQTSDGYASFELGNPLQSDALIGTAAVTSTLKDVSNIATSDQMRSALSEIDNGDGMLLRLGALSGILLAGATGISMLSHHLTVNVFWV
eukprot:CAMPEP_0116151944 /NCGR_PEP_ID=MMETSP0329-20121206/20381_1 /TAXON_ID=697910 /ORGANISM="Pseudo-nitzschia arenysensis, Strain B593" /LENGTH=317 /DNA_ID=CAMNT_0003648619 /DNA_START=37 /DNA_END=991 /DNA_ORIENTATION=+